MSDDLDVADVQGNILRPYGRYGFPFGRHFFFEIGDVESGRRFVQALRPNVTTAEPWDKPDAAGGAGVVRKPQVTLNIGFSCAGLAALGLPTRTLRLLPDEFIDGMARRAPIVGDHGASAPDAWVKAWQGPGQRAHVWVALHAAGQSDGTPVAALGEWTDKVLGMAKAAGAVTALEGHDSAGAGLWQDTAAVMVTNPDGTMTPCSKEHFGFADGVSDPIFEGQLSVGAQAEAVIGAGKIAAGPYHEATSWSALATGEFLLGHVDEGQESFIATEPMNFARNGSFMVWRKLKEDVAAFDAYVDDRAALWMRVTGSNDTVAARETIRAKISGRWSSGIPLMAAPTWSDHQRIVAEYADVIGGPRKPQDEAAKRKAADYQRLLNGFRYGDDPTGAICPLGAHIRRGNPRDMLDPTLSPTSGASTLVNRRRILRRGLPYEDPTGEQGVVFMAICASLFRQFEFIQQQWMNYGLDFDAGNDTCPLVGARGQPAKHVVPAGAANAEPFIAAALPQFVTTRGGDYFFIPSLTAIRMIAMGTVDPT